MKKIKKFTVIIFTLIMIFNCTFITSFASASNRNFNEILVLLKVNETTKSIDFCAEYSGDSLQDICNALGLQELDIKSIKLINKSNDYATKDGFYKITEGKNNILLITLYDGTVGKPLEILQHNPNVTSVERNSAMYVNTNNYSDVISGSWYSSYVNYVTDKGLMIGYSNGKFGPMDTITRAMACQILYACAGYPEVDGTNILFSDVENDKWYAKAVTWAKQNCVVAGTSATTFSPNNPITRGEFAVIIVSYAKTQGIYLPPKDSYTYFKDQYKIKKWMKDPIQTLYRSGIVVGDGDGYFAPYNSLTRAQAATIIYALCTKGVTEETGLISKYGININIEAYKNEMPVPVITPNQSVTNKGYILVTIGHNESVSSLISMDKYVYIKSVNIDNEYCLTEMSGNKYKVSGLDFAGEEMFTVEFTVVIGTRYETVTFNPVVTILW